MEIADYMNTALEENDKYKNINNTLIVCQLDTRMNIQIKMKVEMTCTLFIWQY